MRIYLPGEAPEHRPRGYRQRRRPSRFFLFSLALFFFGIFLLVGVVLLVGALPLKAALGGALTAAGLSTIWKGFGA